MKAKKTNLQKVITPKKGDSDATLEIKRYIGALTEEYQGRTSAVAEQYQGLCGKIDEVKEILNEHGRMLNEHDRKLDMHTEMIGNIMEDISVIKSDLKIKVDYSEFASLAKRVSLIETKIRR
jgi:hypothetical protein